MPFKLWLGCKFNIFNIFRLSGKYWKHGICVSEISMMIQFWFIYVLVWYCDKKNQNHIYHFSYL